MNNKNYRHLRLVLLAAVIICSGASPLFVAVAGTVSPNATVEARVREVFADVPDMILIAKCESAFRQFSAVDVVLRGGTNKKYIGIFQIGERLHAADAAALGHDIFTIDGNIAYARKLYEKSGTVPWRECVPKKISQAPAPTIVSTSQVTTPVVVPASNAPSDMRLTMDLRPGMKHEQVRILQQMLNANGFVVVASGAGSPGKEFDKFGPLTRDAVRRFQCAKQIVCEGDEYRTGYGRVGPKTRALLLQL